MLQYHQIMQSIIDALKNAAKELFSVDVQPELTRPDEQFGDYATNVALQLAGKVGKNPREVAESLSAHLKDTLRDAKEVTVADPGFINIKLSDQALLGQASAAPNTKPQTHKGKVVVAEYSDPNPFKVMHAGHLYTTLVGDSIATLFEVAGAKVHRVNYGGDVGQHVARAMWGILKELGGAFPDKLNEIPEEERATWLSQRYVEGTTAFEESSQAGADPQVKIDVITLNKIIYNIHSKERPLLVLMTPCSLGSDSDSLLSENIEKIYWTCRQWSYDGFDKLYKELGVKPFERYIPESEATPLGLEIVKKGLDQGVFEISEGAIIFKGEDHGLHTRVFVNSDGLPTYEAKDLGLAELKWRDYQFDKSFIITGNDIIDYMKVVVKALEHFHPEVAGRGIHLTHGMIRLPGGKKMSSRKGNNPKAKDILDAAREANKRARGADDPQVSNGAVKYAFLKHRIGGDMVYDPEESVSLEGNSGPYLQYAHARARSVLAKATPNQSAGSDLDSQERSLARKIGEYPEVLQKAVNELMPHHICTYLYELAQVFNRFYEASRVVGDTRQDLRLRLVGLYADVLKDGLNLLRISAPDKL